MPKRVKDPPIVTFNQPLPFCWFGYNMDFVSPVVRFNKLIDPVNLFTDVVEFLSIFKGDRLVSLESHRPLCNVKGNLIEIYQDYLGGNVLLPLLLELPENLFYNEINASERHYSEFPKWITVTFLHVSIPRQ